MNTNTATTQLSLYLSFFIARPQNLADAKPHKK